MSYFKAVPIIFFSIFVAACDHPIQIVGDGDVTSASGSRSCYLENYRARSANCTKNTVFGAYAETYYATPRTGWKFDKWMNYCTNSKINECRFNTPADVVKQNWGAKVPPLVAVFKEISVAIDPTTPYGSLKITGGSVPSPFVPNTTSGRSAGAAEGFLQTVWTSVIVGGEDWTVVASISSNYQGLTGSSIAFGRFPSEYTCESGIYGSYGDCSGASFDDNTRRVTFSNVRLQAPGFGSVITMNGVLLY